MVRWLVTTPEKQTLTKNGDVMTKRHAAKLLEARQRVREMDVFDGREDRRIATIIMALENGLKRDLEQESAYDALYMLIDVIGGICIRREELCNMNLKELFMDLDAGPDDAMRGESNGEDISPF